MTLGRTISVGGNKKRQHKGTEHKENQIA